MRFPEKIQSVCDELEVYYLKRTKNPSVTEEVVEYAASTCWMRWGANDLVSLKRLMFTVAKNYIINLSRKQKPRDNAISFDLLPARVSAGPEEAIVIGLHEGLSTLPPRWQELLELVYFQHKTKTRTAQLMGKSLATIKRWHDDALERLRGVLPAYSD